MVPFNILSEAEEEQSVCLVKVSFGEGDVSSGEKREIYD